MPENLKQFVKRVRQEMREEFRDELLKEVLENSGEEVLDKAFEDATLRKKAATKLSFEERVEGLTKAQLRQALSAAEDGDVLETDREVTPPPAPPNEQGSESSE